MDQLALPLIAIGTFYILSNKKESEDENDNEKECMRENFSNMNKRSFQSNISELPNTNVINDNFPNLQPIEVKNKNYVKQYFNPNQTTDKILDSDKN